MYSSLFKGFTSINEINRNNNSVVKPITQFNLHRISYVKRRSDLITFKVGRKHLRTFTTMLLENSKEEKHFSFRKFASRRCRIKKALLHQVATKINAMEGKSACIPRFSKKSSLVIMNAGSTKKTFVDFKTALCDYIETEKEKEDITKLCLEFFKNEANSIFRAQTMLLSSYWAK